jgi:hypothetical protein
MIFLFAKCCDLALFHEPRASLMLFHLSNGVRLIPFLDESRIDLTPLFFDMKSEGLSTENKGKFNHIDNISNA